MAVRMLAVPVSGGLAGGEGDEGRDGHARRERADRDGDRGGLFRELVHGGHGAGGGERSGERQGWREELRERTLASSLSVVTSKRPGGVLK